MDKSKIGQIQWFDLTVPDAENVSAFYHEVVGWEKEGLSMGDYNDYVMKAGEDAVAGVCHSKGPNKDLPPQWLPYIVVADLDKSLENCTKMGGKVVGEKKKMGPEGHYCLVQDPAGAYVMLCG